jgi:hypothetical protein
MKKEKYIHSNNIDYQMLDKKEIVGKKIIGFELLLDKETGSGDELVIYLEDGKEIEISLLLNGQILVQSD